MWASEWEWVLGEWVLNRKKRGKRLREIWSTNFRNKTLQFLPELLGREGNECAHFLGLMPVEVHTAQQD